MKVFIPVAVLGIFAFSADNTFATLAHRYSFSTDASDSVGTADLTLVGTASVTGGALDLPGGAARTNNAEAQGSSLTELAGTINGSSAITMEAWFNQDVDVDWSKIMMTGTDTNTYMDITPRRGADGNVSSSSINDTSHDENNVKSAFGALTNGTDYYMAAIWDENTNLMTIFVGPVGGSLTKTTAGMGGQDLGNVSINQFYLGSAVGFGDSDFNGQIDEFRIHTNALSDAAIQASFAVGPNRVTPAPEPSTVVLAALGIVGLALRRRRSRA